MSTSPAVHPHAPVTYLVGVESPEVELFFEERTAHVGGVVQLAGAVVVEDLREDARMSVEEVLVEYRVVVGERLGEAWQPSCRDLLERRLVRLVADAADVEHDAVLGVRHHRRRHHLRRRRRRASVRRRDHFRFRRRRLEYKTTRRRAAGERCRINARWVADSGEMNSLLYRCFVAAAAAGCCCCCCTTHAQRW